MRIMAIDYGDAHTGIAISDPTGFLAGFTTTIDAHQILMTGGKNAKKRKKVVDAVAASLILEGYLTYKKSHL